MAFSSRVISIVVVVVVARILSIFCSFFVHGLGFYRLDDWVFFFLGIVVSLLLFVSLFLLNNFVLRLDVWKGVLFLFPSEALLFVFVQFVISFKNLAHPASLAIYSTLQVELFVVVGFIIVVACFVCLKFLWGVVKGWSGFQ